MAHVVRTTFPPTPNSPRLARKWAEDCLAEWHVDDTDGVVMLMLSELVTNAVQHARTSLSVTLTLDQPMIEVAIADEAPLTAAVTPDRRHASEALLSRGRGLAIIEALADTWGVSATPTGKRVWFRSVLARPQ